ncbi:MAG: biotin/lipoyl-binding protein [Opitutales bacterium]|nr:biotin/lipoyl-binding protein [Opitutales bacterium]
MRTYELTISDKEYKVKVKSFSLDHAVLEIGEDTYEVDVKNVGDDLAGRPAPRALPTSSAPTAGGASKTAASSSKPAAASGGEGAVTAPIPGAVMEVFVKEGDEVKAGQPVVKMEAMKMENIINSHIDGTVASISVIAGDAVSQGQELVAIS